MIEKVKDRMQKLVDDCDIVQRFSMNYKVCDGAGGGIGALIFGRTAVD